MMMRQRPSWLITANYFTILFSLCLFLTPSVLSAQTCTGNAITVVSQTGVVNPNSALGSPNSGSAQLYDSGDQIVLELSNTLTSGMSFTIRWRRAIGTSSNPSVAVETSSDGSTFTAIAGSPITLIQSQYLNQNVAVTSATKYVRVTSQNAFNTDLDAITFDCTPFLAVTSATCANTTEIGGIVFNDFNANGSLNFGATYDESGISGITISAYDSDDAPNSPTATATSNSNGSYLLTGLAAGQNYRIETLWSSSWLKAGAAGNTTTRFVNAGTCNVNIGLNNPANYCESNPQIVTTCFVDGNPLGGGTSANGDVLVTYPFSSSGTDVTNMDKVAINSQIGSTWGLAFQRSTKSIFAAAVMKRHTGFGSLGIDGIYKIDYSNPASPVITNWLDLNTLSGVDVGTDPRTYSLPANLAVGSADPAAFGVVGKIGIGDMDISEDDAVLYAMNLNNNGSVVLIDIATKTLIQNIPITNPGCGAATDVRPWAVEHFQGSLYVGLICSGQSAGVGDMNYFVMKWTGSAWTTVSSGALGYPKGRVHNDFPAVCTAWETWTDNFSDLSQAGSSGAGPRWCRPQPILSDMEFDEQGNLYLGFLDRTGNQTGYLQRSTDDTQTGNGYVGGDLLKVAYSGGIYTLENGGTTVNGGGVGANGQGPGGGEFFGDENLTVDNNADGIPEEVHQETSLGALGYLAGYGQIAVNVMDPLNIWSGGTAFMNKDYGTVDRQFQLYNSTATGGTAEPGTFGKAAGLGDIELLCSPAPIEIGNRVWTDTDNDGIQDPNETGIDGVIVNLYKNGALIGTATTSGGGRYGFSSATSGTATGFVYNISQLQAAMAYELRIESYATQASINTLVPTTVDNGGSDANTDVRDSDGSISGLNVIKAFSTEGVGANNHNYDFGFMAAPLCEISVTTNVSGCYDSNGNTTGGSSVTTVQAIVDWSNNPSGETINVTCTGATAQSINPATASKPAILNFEVPANGSAVTITSTFSTSTTCTATQNVTAPAGNCLLTPCVAGNTGGSVWRDFNNDGIKDATETSGVSGVTVTAYDCNGNVAATTTTDALGQYTFTTLTPSATNKYRIEFSNTPPQYKPTFSGTNGKTDVQFITAASCTVDLGINNPADYCQINPNLATNCYGFGNQVTGINNTRDVLVSYPYLAGNASFTNDINIYDQPTTHDLSIKANQIGTTWGLSYSRTNKRLYTAAYFKKHSGFGTGLDATENTADDAGAIYLVDPTTNAVTNVFTVPNATTNAHDIAGNNYNSDNGDIAWDGVGKTSLGGIDLSDDDNILYVMNLEDRKLYALNSTTGAVLTSQVVPMAPPGCPNASDVRPFTVEYHNQKVYVGMVCSGESTGIRDNLIAYVYEADPTTLAFGSSPVLQFKLNYLRGKLNSSNTTANWQAWTPTFTNTNPAANRLSYPMPMLTSITFNKGNMILSLRDRISDIAGNNALDNPVNTTLYQARIAGDILHASYTTGGNWLIESNGRSGGLGTAVQNTNQGLGGAEFFQGDAYPYVSGTPLIQGIGTNHDEISLGAVYQLAGYPEVIAVMYDPVPDNGSEGFHDAGIRWLSNTTGALARAYRLYKGDGSVGSADFGKGGGLGDVVAMCNPSPIQIGNYVWIDTDKDGVQDPCEGPLSNITLSLWKNGVQVATTTTDANGNYAFTGIGAPNETWTATSGTDSILPNMAYEVRISTTQTGITTPNYGLTTANNTTNSGNDQNDSDAAVVGTNAVITFTTGAAGSTNHTLDFGFAPIPLCTAPTLTSVATQMATCTNGIANSDAKVAVRGIVGMTSYAYGTNGTAGLFALNATASTIDSIQLTSLANPSVATTYTFRVWGVDTTCYNDTTVVLNPKNCYVVKSCTSNAPANNDFELGTTVQPESFAGGIKYRLRNGDMTSWDTATQKGNEFRISSPMAASGNYYVYSFTKGTTATGDDACLEQRSISVSPNTKYVLCVYAADAKADGKKSGIALEIQEKNAGGGDSQPFHYKVDTLPDNPNWRDTSLSLIPWALHTYTFVTAATTSNVTLWISSNAINGDTSFAVLDMVCLQPAPLPTIVSVAVETATCTNGVANNNATIAVRGIGGMARYAYGTNGTTGLFAATATASTADSIKLTGLANPSVSTTYTFRIYAADTTCYNDTTVILTPSVCPSCSITATFTQGACNNNGTTAISTDDYFTVAVSNVTSTNGGISGKYEVMLNGSVLNIGGTTYGTPVTVGGILDFKSDGVTTYDLTVRDVDITTCATTVFTTTAAASCSTINCKPMICMPVTVTRH